MNGRTPPSRPHPLLFVACTCRAVPGACLACARWRKHYQHLNARVRAWKVKA